MLKKRKEPGIFYVVRVLLMFNIATTIFLAVIITGAIIYDGVKAPDSTLEVVLDVRSHGIDTTQTHAADVPYHFKQSKKGDLSVQLPWLVQLALPLSFLNIGGFEFSPPYLIFHVIICFLLYRIVASLSMEGPFIDKNIQRIFWIGYSMIIYDVFMLIRNVWMGLYVERLTGNVYQYDNFTQLMFLKFGIVVIIIAMVYRRGVAIQREQELTI